MKKLLLCLAALLMLEAPAHAQTAPRKYLSAATTNSTLVLGRKTMLGSLSVSNTTATIEYLKLYDKVTAPTCGTDAPKWTLMIPANAVVSPDLSAGGLEFFSGLGFCLTGGFADADTAAAVTGVIIDLGATGQ